ncbi:MAG: NAD-dependent epimerase/dehydratase [Candidatus Woesebacteria bacterium GW2011_GWA1_39_8]|uniref:NAD-dependent epimerase/dehydratase n=1 Tax=Candidatus Woesebacteria bacterium GW2011_GWA1_39_8 TaxID=1618552 RepID=A0A0G0S4X6_9BACT|nr:MAG: NAD-dependent epimerase/dehydratase [Candidatus Woesebacteria bacterium GW2011_GWA1_39_8]
MKRVGITGYSDLVGTHLRFYFHKRKDDFSLVLIDDDFSKLADCDAVIHLAELNRGGEEEVYNTNINLTKKVLQALDYNKKPKIIFLSSTHRAGETAYGKAKRESEKMIAEWGEKNKTGTVSIVGPNIFGEFARPYYNTFITTFCHELIEKKNSNINESAFARPIYAEDICSLIFEALIAESPEGIIESLGREMKVGEIYSLLKHFRDEYFSGIIPQCKDKFEQHLFNTFRSCLPANFFPVGIELKKDDRGELFEIVKEKTGGQAFFSTTKPGVVRGNHYHTRKIERFCVVKGEASIKMRKLLSDEILEYKVSGDKPAYVDMPTYYTHSIENIGSEELLTMFWSNEIFNPADPDTFFEPVII